MMPAREGSSLRVRAPAALGLLLLLLAAAGARDARAADAARRAAWLRAARASLDAGYRELESLYRELHQQPELSLQEERTAARLARALADLGLEVTLKVGGHGVVGVLRNGAGPTVLVRTDMDALPVTEQTDLPYASRVRVKDRSGAEVGVMHACGHDMHMACWVGTARTLVGLKERWSGTLVMIAQPAEEIGAGARAMLADGLFRRFPRPDYCLALHCTPEHAAGQVAWREGPILANVDTVDIVVKGRGGHGAAPHTTVDPIVLAARVVLDLQTLVSRERDPVAPAVITVGSIHGGTKHNIIPDEVRLQLTVRSASDGVRKQLLEGIERVARSAAAGARAPEPEVRIDPDQNTPVTVNDPPLTRRLTALFREVLGPENVHEKPLSMGGEDFGRYGREGIPSMLYYLGTLPEEQIARARQPGGPPLPSLHSSLYYPVVEPSLRTGVLTMTLAVLELAGR